MSGGRAALTGLLGVSLVLTLIPFASAAGLSFEPLGVAPRSTFRVDLTPLPGSGAMLLAAVGPYGAQFFELREDGAGPAVRLASFDFEPQPEGSPLAAPHLAAASASRVALAYTSEGAPWLLIIDPYLGEVVAQFPLAAEGESAGHPSVAVAGGAFVAAYTSPGAPAQVTVLSISSDGAVVSRDTVAVAGVASAALVPAEPAPRLAVLQSDRVALFSLAGGSSPVALGTFPFAASAGALWARDGSLEGLLSTASGLVRVQAPLDEPSKATKSFLAGGASASSVSAAASSDGLLVAVVRTAAGTLALREDSVGEFVSASVADILAESTSVDSYGLARTAVVRGAGTVRSIETLTAGDPDAVAVTASGPSTVLPAGTAELTVHLRAVRSPLTVVGLYAALPAGWSASAPTLSLPLAKGGEADVKVVVEAPAGAALGAHALRFAPAVLEIPVPSSVSWALSVVEGPLVAPVCCPSSVELGPGDSTVVTVGVVNRGATPVVSEVRAAAPPGVLVSPSFSTISLASGESRQLSFTVTIAQGSPPSDTGEVTLFVQPTDGSSESAISFGAHVRKVFAPALTFVSRDIGAAPGESIALPYALVNSGNVGGWVSLTVAVTGLASSALTGYENAVFVPAYGRVDMPLRLTLPESTTAGTSYSVAVSAARLSDAVSVGGPFAMTGRAKAAPSFVVSFAAGPAVAPSSESTGTLTLSNLGNAALSFSLSFTGVEPGFAPRVVGGASTGIVVPAFSTRSVDLAVRAPELATPGVRMLGLTAAAPGVAPATLDLPVEVLATHAIALRLRSVPAPLASPLVAAAPVEFEVENSGNAPASVAFTFGAHALSLSTLPDSGQPVAAALGSLQTIPAHGRVAFRAFLRPDFGGTGDQARATVLVESSLGDSAVAAVEFTRLRSDPRVVDLSVLPPTDPVRSGNLHRLFANINNLGPGDATELDAVFAIDGTVVGRLAVDQGADVLRAGTTRLVAFEFVPTKDSSVLRVSLAPRGVLLDRDLGNNALSTEFVTDIAEPAPSLAPPAAAPVAASISIITVVALALSEIGKSTLISVLFLPLYVKLKPEEVLDQYLRGQIHGYIIANPGEHYNAIKDQLGVTNGALAYHLRVLERAQLIRATRDGMYKRFWPIGMKIPKRRRLTSFQDAIVKTVRDNPAVSQKRIAEMLGVSNQVVNYHVKSLEESGILKIDRSERASKVFLGPEAPPAEPAPPAPMPLLDPTAPPTP